MNDIRTDVHGDTHGDVSVDELRLSEELTGTGSAAASADIAEYAPVSYTHLTLPTNREV